jgi:hypothetical protein
MWNRNDIPRACRTSAIRTFFMVKAITSIKSVSVNKTQTSRQTPQRVNKRCMSLRTLCNRLLLFQDYRPITSLSGRSPAVVPRAGVSQSGKAWTCRVDATQAPRSTFAVWRDNSSPSRLCALYTPYYIVNNTRPSILPDAAGNQESHVSTPTQPLNEQHGGTAGPRGGQRQYTLAQSRTTRVRPQYHRRASGKGPRCQSGCHTPRSLCSWQSTLRRTERGHSAAMLTLCF